MSGVLAAIIGIVVGVIVGIPLTIILVCAASYPERDTWPTSDFYRDDERLP